MFSALFLLLLSALSVSNANTLQGTIDLKRLQTILQENVRSKDLTSLYFSIKGLVQLNANIPNVCEVSNLKCEFLSKINTFFLYNNIIYKTKSLISRYVDHNIDMPIENVGIT